MVFESQGRGDMEIFLLDGGAIRRDWDGIFDIVEYSFIFNRNFEDIIYEIIEPNDLIIVHYTPFKNKENTLIEHFKKKGCYVLFIAGNSFDSSGNDQFPRIYKRKTSVEPSGIDEQFATCLKRLISHLEDSPKLPDWSLIEPPPFPEYLLSAYILQCAVENGLDKNELRMDDTFWSNALEELKVQQAQIPDNTDTPTELFLDTGYENVRQVLTKIIKDHTS